MTEQVPEKIKQFERRMTGMEKGANVAMMEQLAQKTDWYTTYKGKRLYGSLDAIHTQKAAIDAEG
jgi:hypothetical protein